MSLPFDIDALRTFVLLADNGHFTETARLLEISQPAVSQRISKLENTFGLVLFTRCAERAVLTPYGEKILPASRRCVDRHCALKFRLRSSSQEAERGRIRIWIDPSSLGEEMAAFIDREAALEPGIQIATGGRQDWRDGLRSGACDLAFSGVFLQGSAPFGLKRVDLRHETGLSAMWPCGQDACSVETFSLAGLLEASVLIGSERMAPGFRGFVDGWCRRVYGRAPFHVLEFDTCSALLRACRNGQGIGVVPGDVRARFTLPAGEMESRNLFGEVLPNAYACALHLRTGETNPGVLAAAHSCIGRVRPLLERWKPAAPGREARAV